MKETAITVTDAARNFADCINRTHYQGMRFLLLKNGKPFARLVPAAEKVCRGRDLAAALADVKLPADGARAWNRDLRRAHRNLKPPADPWR